MAMRRMTASLAGMLTAGALVLTGCGSVGGGHSAAPVARAAKHNTADVMFAQMMIPHHRQAVDMTKLADGTAGPQVAKLAAAIKGAQGPEIAEMSGWLKSWGERVPSGDDAGMGHMDHGGDTGMMSEADMKKLSKTSGGAFDRTFCTMMIKHHQGAVNMARTEVRDGAYPAARTLARSIITTQNAEIAKMRKMLKSG